MNYLILANGATKHYNFDRALREELKERGHNVFYALDSVISRDYNGLKKESNVFIFTDYLKNCPADISNPDKETREAYDRFRAWNFYPDFDRSNYSNIIPPRVSNEQSNYIIINMFLFLRDIIEKNTIQGIFYESASNLLALTAEYLANNCFFIPYYGLGFARFPERAFISREIRNESKIICEKMESIIRKEIHIDKEISDYVQQYIKGFETIVPSYMKINGLSDSFFERYFKKEKIGILLFRLKNSFCPNPYDFQVGIPIKTSALMVWRNFRRMIKSYSIKKFYSIKKDTVNEKFILYPLHFHPEASTSVLANNYGSEYEVIRNISFSLPLGVKLYVKEHPSAAALDDYHFYKALVRLPNVRFVPHYFNARELIKKSSGVITLASTVGYEALVLKKKVLIFGRVFYECHRNARRIERLSDLPQLMDWLVEPLHQDDIDDYNKLFLQAYYLTSFHLPLNYNDCNKQHQRENAVKLLDYLKI